MLNPVERALGGVVVSEHAQRFALRICQSLLAVVAD